MALVTGSASGLGRLIALGLGAEGAAVAVVDVEEERAREVAAEVAADGGRALGVRCDVAAGSEVERAARTVAERLGPVDLLVNNAAVTSDEELVDKSEEAWDREVDITLKGAFLCARAVLPGMVERGRGAIVSIGSVNGLAFFGNEAYSAAKAGLVSLTRSIAVRYGPRACAPTWWRRAPCARPPGTRASPATRRPSTGLPGGTPWDGWASPRRSSAPSCSCSPTRRRGSPARSSPWTAACWPGTGRWRARSWERTGQTPDRAWPYPPRTRIASTSMSNPGRAAGIVVRTGSGSSK